MRVEELARRLRRELGARRIWVIGSLDAPWFHEMSDVDLVVDGLTESDAVDAERCAIEMVRRPVDLLRFETLSPSFQDAVVREGRQLS